MDFSSWYETNGHRLTAGGVWLRGCGWNLLPPSAMRERPFRLLIARLSSYFDAVDSWTHRLLYAIAASDPSTYPDLAFLPPPNDIPVFKQAGVPWWLGISSKQGPSDFHLLAVSNSCVQELTNLPVLLERSGIPLSKSERMARPDLPLVLLGGANSLHTSVFWTDDPPVDGVFAGSGPDPVAGVFRLCREGREQGFSKSVVLESLESLPGFMLPDRPKRTRISRQSAKTDWIPSNAPVLPGESQAGGAPLWISSGCPSSCSFCAESWALKPYREYPEETLLREMEGLKAGMGLSQIELAAFNFNAHRRFADLISSAADRFERVRLKSQRFDRFASDPGLAPLLHAVGKTNLTCGLEGISGRLRRYLNKQIDDERLFSSLAEIHKVPLRSLKIFLIATGLETGDDYREFEALLDRIRSIQARSGRGPGVQFSVTPLVRFPWTPLEFEDAPSMETVSEAVRGIGRSVTSKGFEFRESASSEEYWLSQVLVRPGASGIWEILKRASLETERLYFRSVPARFVMEFRSRLAAAGMDPDSLLKGHTVDEGLEKPWRLVETGVSYDSLAARWGQNRNFIETRPCGRPDPAAESCGDCAACPDLPHPGRAPIPGRFVEDLARRVTAVRKSIIEIRVSVRAGRNFRGVDRTLLGSAVSSALMRADSLLIPHYFGFSGSFWQSRENPAWLWGEDILTLRWKPEGLPALKRLLADQNRLAEVNRLLGSTGALRGEVQDEPATFRFRILSPFPFEASDYFRSKGLSATRTGPSDGNQTFTFSGPALKKKILKSLTVSRTSGGEIWTIELTAGVKFSVEDFLKGSFRLQDKRDWMAIDAECVEVT
ncbi:MAG: radical SAM protein [bacterium]|nr:radical SAM protein [bacterium]